MSALPPKADVNGYGAGGPLLTQTGSRLSWIDGQIRAGMMGRDLVGAEMANLGRSEPLANSSALPQEQVAASMDRSALPSIPPQ